MKKPSEYDILRATLYAQVYAAWETAAAQDPIKGLIGADQRARGAVAHLNELIREITPP